jgi:pyridoxamine 5'-phosphate oxidase
VAPIDPIDQFRAWLDDASAAAIREPTAGALATASKDARPSARMLLLKGFDQRGFVFSTNYESRKARELEENPWASLLFHWDPLERQVRIEGRVFKIGGEESDAIFRARPRGARLGSWASPQSRAIATREALETRLRQMQRRFPGEVPRPPFWGGYRLEPARLEFWQAGENRLHDRLLYARLPDGSWQVERLAP